MVCTRLVRFLSIAAVCVGISAVGCNGLFAPGFVNDGATGQLRMLLTDDPYPYEFVAEAWVTVTRVEVLRAQDDDDAESEPDEADDPDAGDDSTSDDDPNDGGALGDSGDPNGGDKDLAFQSADPNDAGAGDPSDDADLDPAADGSDGGDEGDEPDADGEDEGGRPFIVVYDHPEGQEFNLFELRNGRVVELFETELPAGHYKQVRIIVSGGRVVLTDQREFPLRVPSGDRTGIKLHFDFEVSEDQETELLLDFDLRCAFVPRPGGEHARAGDILEFNFRPSYAVRLADLGESGSLSGKVTDADGNPLANVEVRAFDGEEEVAAAVTEADGSYEFLGLPPGEYRLEFEGDGFEQFELAGQSVLAGEETPNADATLSAASAP